MKTRPFDVSEYLTDSDSIQIYLQDMLEEGGIESLQKALGDVAKASGMTKLAEDTNLGRQNLYKALTLNSSPKFETINKIIEALGFKIAIVKSKQEESVEVSEMLSKFS